MIDASDKNKIYALEAVLFGMGQAVSVETLALSIDSPVEETERLLQELTKDYEEEKRGLKLIRMDNDYQLCSRPDYYEAIIKVATAPQKPVMTGVMLEVLSIIAYKQPVTRGEIEKIRGVSSDYAINRLIEFGLIEEAGRLEAPGRPILFKTTENFLRFFGLNSVTDLPSFDDLTKFAVEEVYRNTGMAMDGQLSFEFDKMEGDQEA